MARLIVLAAIAAIFLWYFAPRRWSIERYLPALAVGLALAYLIAPIDLIPDTGLVGVFDDIAVLAAAAMWIRRQRQATSQRATRPPRSVQPEPPDQDPHEILGVRRGASPEEITRAYREKMKLYHPDRVNGLGEELQAIATRKTLEIQRAYETLRPPRA